MAIFNLNINGRTETVDVDSATPLLYVLIDDLELRGPKFGCGLGQCGSCTVIADDRAVRACITPIENVAGAAITSLEGLGTPEDPHPIQEAFIDEQAIQCGFCMSGVILTAKAFLDRNPEASDEQLREALSTVLCRCGTHVRIMDAIRRYAGEVTA
jgi:nicotinate dehydrogenase subunit A